MIFKPFIIATYFDVTANMYLLSTSSIISIMARNMCCINCKVEISAVQLQYLHGLLRLGLKMTKIGRNRLRYQYY